MVTVPTKDSLGKHKKDTLVDNDLSHCALFLALKSKIYMNSHVALARDFNMHLNLQLYSV